MSASTSCGSASPQDEWWNWDITLLLPEYPGEQVCLVYTLYRQLVQNWNEVVSVDTSMNLIKETGVDKVNDNLYSISPSTARDALILLERHAIVSPNEFVDFIKTH